MFSVKQKTGKYMSLVVTHECNLACAFCVDKYRGSGEFIEMKTVGSALAEAKTKGVEDILIIGGEPTLHPKIVEIARMVKAEGFRAIMTTNYMLPDVVGRLDGIIDCFNISYYKQKALPCQSSMKSDITLHALIHKKSLNSKQKIDGFIDKHQSVGHIKFSTLSPCNDWAKRNQVGDFLDELDCERVVLFNEMLGQIYRGAIIKRYDRVLTLDAEQSLKAHVDGEISISWDRGLTA